MHGVRWHLLLAMVAMAVLGRAHAEEAGARKADAVSRVGLGAGRPLLTVNPRATLRYLLDQRRPLYEEVATLTVATDGRVPEDIAAEVAKSLHR